RPDVSSSAVRTSAASVSNGSVGPPRSEGMPASYHADLPRTQGKKPLQPFLHAEQIHGEFVQIHPDLLQARQVLDHRLPVLAPVPGELVSPERGVRLDLVPGVDPHGAGLEALGHAMGTLHVTRLHPGGEPINHVVADSNRIVLVAEADDAADWTEDLLL